ncbi:MAG: hypothetical protein ABI591_12380 [Kofleriaceae bacterium]
MKFLFSAFVMIALVGCRDREHKPASALAPTPAGSDAAIVVGNGSGSGSGSADDAYVAGEFKSGMQRFKDVAVYVDGKPVGFLAFGELPITLKPTWVKHKVNIDKPLDCKECKIWKWGEQRYYRFNDYLRAIGIDPKTIVQIHVQGPKETNTIVATGHDLMQPNADDFSFFFGLHVRGKPIPHVPLNFGNGLDPDKITAVMIYIHKTPPTFDGGGYVVDGRPIEGVPYFGEPVRGGVRIYLDDKLATIIKRQDLDAKQAVASSDGELSWSLWGFLKSRGVDTSKVVEGWVIRDDTRQEKFPTSALASMTFEAPSKSGKSQSGAVLLGEQKVVANVIALHTHALKADELPAIRPDEQD